MDLNSRIFASGPVVLFQWQMAPGCPIQSVSPNVEQILGYSAFELCAENKIYEQLIHPDDREDVHKQVQQNMDNGIDEFDRLDYRLVRKDGSIAWVEDHTVVVRDEQNVPVQFVGYIIDVTDRHNMEQRSFIHQEKLQAITDLMSDWAWEVDQNGIYTYCSNRVEEFLGYSADEIVGKTPFDLMPEDEAARVAEIFIEIVKNRAPIRDLENWNLDKNGNPVCLLTNGIPLFSENGELVGYRGVDKDITEQKNNEQLLRLAHKTAIDALRVKNEFMANMSHELRTPLNGIDASLQILLSTELDDVQRNFANIASDSSKHLIELVDNILNYTSLQSGRTVIKPQQVSLHELLHSHYKTNQLAAKNENINLELNIDKDVPAEIKTDPLWLGQVLNHLTNNAIKFTPSGKVLLNVALDNNQGLRFQVHDEGIGIDKDKCEKVFEPFYQVESNAARQFEGTGLGLTLSKDVVNQLGGNIGIDSEPGKGTKVWFTLPVED